jgi:glycosyltransferase involved in cell wall biosynthesis
VTPRVLHVVEAIEAGVARHLTDVVSHVDADHHVLVAPRRVGGYTDARAFERMEQAGASIHLAEMRRTAPHPRNALAAIRARGLISRTRPDVVHGHASIGGAVGRLAALGTPARAMYTPHGLLPNRAALAAERQLGRFTDVFVAVSRSEADQAARLGVARPGRIATVPNGIELDWQPEPDLDLRSRLGVEAGVPLVGTVGRLAPQKAPELFVDACVRVAERSRACFVLIGDGPLRGVVEARIAGSGIRERFLLLPGVPDAASLMPQLDVFALASRYEAGPYSPLEAMRARVPVVLTDVIGNRDTVAAGESGLLAAPDDPAALAAAILSLLDDPEQGRRLAAGASASLAERFDVRAMAASLGELYASRRR